MTCYACDNEPTQQCPRCGRPYCDEHGEDFCGVCLEPASGVPSFNLYRGSLLALIVGAVLALWLIIQPTGGESSSGPRVVVLTATSAAGAVRATPGVNTTAAAGNATPAAVTSPVGTSFAGAPTARAGTPSTSGTATGSTPAASPGTYVVVSGDNLTLICDSKIRKPAGMTNPDCVDQIKSLNALSSDSISVGQSLKVPQ
jgi:LysM repeat protein